MSRPLSTPNSDESLTTKAAPFIGNFHKTLPHDEFGEVDAAAYRVFERTCVQIEAGAPLNFEAVPAGPSVLPGQTDFLLDSTDEKRKPAKFTSPLAGASTETHGPDPKTLEMMPAPGILSASSTAELVELYWMALLRDAPLAAFQEHTHWTPSTAEDTKLGYKLSSRLKVAQTSINTVFDLASKDASDPGHLRAPTDFDAGVGGAEVKLQSLFRCGLHDEDKGPLVSQFFLQPTIGYGVQTIDLRQVPYAARRDYLTNHGDWLLAQNTGKDKYGRDYGSCNHLQDQLHANPAPTYYPKKDATHYVRRSVSTIRDLARFVNRDALHQAYFNAALFLLGVGAATDAGNPYRGNLYSREGGFATLGGPDLLTLVSEVASRALKVIWRQKWLVHRRARPEVLAGLVQMERNGFKGEKRVYGLDTTFARTPKFNSAVEKTLQEIAAHNKALNGGDATYFLPMAYSAGSPSHPSYGAGHATVAGACVTVLKAWFDEDAKLADTFAKKNKDGFSDPPVQAWFEEDAKLAHTFAKKNKEGFADPPEGRVQEGGLLILEPGVRDAGGSIEDFCVPQAYVGDDAGELTVGGELNKLASNVAMGRSMGGVHYRSDNTRSLRLGEAIAIEILRKRTAEYAERPVSFSFRSFDRARVFITGGQVSVS
ncbi:MAG: hypothetical protein H6700_03075 [Myxococcales bacterium]|nr:hypothetical protein [Myxococcales bacterium]